MRYVTVPKEVHVKDIKSEDFCFSPGRYVRFMPPKANANVQFVQLDKLVAVRKDVVKAAKSEFYRYAEIGDIDVDTGGVSFQTFQGYELPNLRPSEARHGDILLSTVRTYRKGIGMVLDDGDNLVTTNAVLNLCGVRDAPKHITLPYVYAFLRTDFFVEQVWALLNKGVYPRMDTDALHRILLPVVTDASVAQYVAALALVIAHKDRMIRKRNAQILSLIQEELASGQKSTPFAYAHPTSHEVRSRLRFDAAIYGKEYKSKIWLVENYKNGFETPQQAGFSITPGPSLEIKLLRTRIDSDTPKPGFYSLLIPANISEYGTMSAEAYLGTPKALPTLRQGDILFGEAGFHKGRSIVLVEDIDNATTNAHGLYARRNDGDLGESIFFRCIFHWYRSQRLIDLMAVGGSGGHFSPQYFDSLLIPKFPDKTKKQVVALYHAAPERPKTALTVDNFVDWHHSWNEGLGIWELDKEMKRLQALLDDVLHRIINGDKVVISF